MMIKESAGCATTNCAQNLVSAFVASLVIFILISDAITQTSLAQQLHNPYQSSSSSLNQPTDRTESHLDGRLLLVDVPVIIHQPTTTLNNSISSLSSTTATPTTLSDSLLSPNYYASSQAQKFRVNVSNVCEKNQMRATIRLSKPFYGLIHARDKRRKPACFLEGTGDQVYTLDISYTLVQSEPAYCGVVAHHLSGPTHLKSNSNQSATTSSGTQQTLSVVLVVRLHKTIEFSDDRYFLLSCANRCSRPDCSSSSQQHDTSLAPVNQAFRGFVASESIVSPVLRATANELAGTGASRLLSADPLANWTTERCDVMLDLKFQWLIKLCWILSILLLLILSIAAYLCLALNRKNRNANIGSSRGSNSSGNLKRDIRIGQHGESRGRQQQQQQQDLFSPPVGQTGSLCWSASGASEELDKIRDDNSCPDKQQQELLLANLLSGKEQLPVSVVTSQQHQQQQPAAQQQLVLGRAADTLAGLQRRHLEAQVKRRRSIGGSSMLPVGPTGPACRSQQQQQQQYGELGRLDAGQRAKSRSQTTIHYEQSQDPFKAVPFSYLNNGYISDTAAMDFYGQQQQPQLQPQVAYSVHEVPVQSSEGRIATALSSQAAQQVMLNRQQRQQQEQSWPGYQGTFAIPTGAPIELMEVASQQQSQPAANSQFDPQNSRQLIDLIQQKHRQQIAQANRTAATMQAQAAKLFAGVGGRAWR